MNKKPNPIWGWMVSTVVVILIIEFSPYVLSKTFLGHSFSRKEVKNELNSFINEPKPDDPGGGDKHTDRDQYLGDHLLHPYFGFVGIPRSGYNRFGFPGEDPLRQKRENEVHIFITGGSVAQQLFNFSRQRLVDNLANDPAFRGKEIHVFLAALGGFKQPQQLIALNYFLALGAHFDFIVNLDGFNEIVLPYSDNLPFGVFPSFPRHWNIYSRKSLDQNVVLYLGKQADIREKRERARNKMNNSFLRHSNFVLFLWKLSDNSKNNQILISESALRKVLEESESDYQSTGPEWLFADTLAFFRQQSAFWAQSSSQISAVAASMGITYLHFLQPNQYDEGSKVLTGDEMELAYESGLFSYKDAARAGYPLLREQGLNLINNNVHFYDLSYMFINEKRTVYSDKCCHFNQLGYDMIVDAISAKIISFAADN